MPKVGFKHSAESIEKIREAKKKNPTRYWLGKKNPHTEEHKRKISEINKRLGITVPILKEESSPHWRGDDVGYSGIHRWIRRAKGVPEKCELCGEEEEEIEWSNKDHQYQR